jgi:glutamyl-tRNA synthetase
MTQDELIKNFDIKNCSSSSPNFSKKEMEELNLKIACQMNFEEISCFLNQKLHIAIDENLWEVIKHNITNFSELNYWKNICEKGEIENYSFEKTDELKNIANLGLKSLPQNPLNNDSWITWVNNIVENNAEISKKQIFIGLRKILTGFEHGPEMKKLLPLIGTENLEKLLQNI